MSLINLSNCKIQNYPLGEPDNQTIGTDLALNNSVNANEIPSHIKLIIKPNNDIENNDGYYAVRAENFSIGTKLKTIAALTNTFTTTIGENISDSRWKEFAYTIDTCSNFGTASDPASTTQYSTSLENLALINSDLGWQQIYSEDFGLNWTPYGTIQNQKSIDLFGNIGNSSMARIYHFSGLNTNEQLLDYDDVDGDGYWFDGYDCTANTDIGLGGGAVWERTLLKPCMVNNSIYVMNQILGDNTLSSNCFPDILGTYQSMFSQDALDSINSVYLDNLMDGLQCNNSDIQSMPRSYRTNTSWSYINRIMICDSMENLGSTLDPENYPIDNEVHVWVELKEDYILSNSATDNPEMWNLKVDIDGNATLIET